MAADEAMDATATSGAMPRVERTGGFRAGDQLGRYVIERVLGAGGMGLVYAAHDPDLDRRVAIKILRNDAGEEARVRLLREARAMAKVSHPNVITVYEVGTSGGIDFVAMELLEGGTLGEWLRAEARPADEVLRRFRTAGAGLIAAHTRGLVHRDFKPANVLLGRDGRIVVTDFGLARGYEADALASTVAPADAAPPPPPVTTAAVALDDTLAQPSQSSPSARTSDLSSTLTRTGAMVGTPAYMAPEQFGGVAVGPAADQFAFAVALWEGLTGTRPFRGDTIEQLRRASERGPEGATALPRDVRPILLRALARDPSARWPDLAALVRALERIATRPRRRRLAVGVGLAAALVAGGGVLVATGGRERRAPTCPLADAEVDRTWSPEVRAKLDAHFADAAGWPVLRKAFDGFAADWKRERADACAAPEARNYHGRIACLAGIRDEVEAALALLSDVPGSMIARPEPSAIIPAPAACRSGTRAAMPPLPADPDLRRRLSALLRDSTTARFASRGPTPTSAFAKADAVLAAARTLAEQYPPALAIGLETKASVTHVAGACADAIPLYEETATAAEASGADGIRAMARIGVLECAMEISSDTAQIQRYADQARAAVQRAGDDPQLTASLELTLTEFDVASGQLDRAIERSAKANAAFVAVGDMRRASNAALREAGLRTSRDDYDDRAEIERLLRQAIELRETSLGASPETERIRLQLGLLVADRDPEAGRELIEQAQRDWKAKAPGANAVTVRGRVRDRDGTPVAGARVFASTGLYAPFTGVPIIQAELEMSEAITDDDGRFTMQAPARSAVIAWTPDRGSTPMRLAPTMELVVEPIQTLEVTARETRARPVATDPNSAVPADTHVNGVFVMTVADSWVYLLFARRTGVDRWTLPRSLPSTAQVAVAASSRLGDQLVEYAPVAPGPGPRTLSVDIDLGGALVDVIVRPDRGQIPTAQVMLFVGPSGKLPTNVIELGRRFGNARRRHGSNAAAVTPVNATAAGQVHYRAGDIHTRLSSVPPGPATLCVLPFAGDLRDPTYMRTLIDNEELEVRCRAITISAEPVQVVVIEAPPMKNAP